MNHRLLNTYISSYHEKLCINQKNDDPMAPPTAFSLTVDFSEFSKAKADANGDASFDPIKMADGVKEQRQEHVSSQYKSKIDTGKDQTMYDRLLKASQAREGILADDLAEFKQVMQQKEIQKLITNNNRETLARTQPVRRLSFLERAEKKKHIDPTKQLDGFSILSQMHA